MGIWLFAAILFAALAGVCATVFALGVRERHRPIALAAYGAGFLVEVLLFCGAVLHLGAQ